MRNIPFTVSVGVAPGDFGKIVVPDKFGWRTEISSMFLSTPTFLPTGGPYLETMTVSGMSDTSRKAADLQVMVLISATSSQQAAIPVNGIIAPGSDLTVSMTDSSGGSNLAGAYLVISGAYVRES